MYEQLQSYTIPKYIHVPGLIGATDIIIILIIIIIIILCPSPSYKRE